MVLSTGVYLFNVFCAMVPCTVTQPPPQAFIGQDSPSNWENNRNYYDGLSSTTSSSLDNIQLPSSISTLVNRDDSSGSRLPSNNGEILLSLGSDEVLTGPRSKRRHHSRSRANSYHSHRLPQQRPQEIVRASRMTELDDDTSSSAVTPARIRNGESNPGQRSGRRESEQSAIQTIRRHPMVSSLFSAIPVIPVLLNNFDNLMKSAARGGGEDEIGTRTGRQSSSRGGRRLAPPLDPPTASTELGEVEGYFMGTMKGRRIAAFEGIPFAEPPTGKYRFRTPVPKRPWKSGTFPATKVGNNCLQAHPLDFFRVTGSEDCLYLNVYTPQIGRLNPTTKFPVIFLIHGGSFQYGSSAEYGPSYMLDEDVILVTTNYRLGPLGFLSTGDSESPGNYGLKDQAMSLKWIYDNIEQFGGDKNKITIMGQSAGGVSAHIHLVANKTTSYFSSGVSLSGSAYGFWPIVQSDRALELTQKLASALNCPKSNSRSLVRCLRFANPNNIIAAQMQLYEWIPFHPLVLFAPVIESPEDPNAFLTRRPEEAYALGEVEKKPWIFGQTSQEGHFNMYFMKLMMQAAPIALNGRKYLPIILDYGRTTSSPKTEEITDKLLEFYGGALLGRGINMFTISNMYTDRFYTTTVRKAIRAHSAIAPKDTYAYLFDFKGKYNLGSLFGSPESEWGVSHTEDMFYYFNSSVYHHGLQKDDTEYGLSQIMTDFLANFISTGTPMHSDGNDTKLPFWDPVNNYGEGKSGPLQYLRIQKKISMMDDPFLKRVQFWDSLSSDLEEDYYQPQFG